MFLFSYFQGGKKTNFFCFQNEKQVWLVVLKNTFFKNKIQETCLVVVFEKVEFCFLWLIFFFLNYIYSNSKTRLVSCFEKHNFQKQNLGNLFGSCF